MLGDDKFLELKRANWGLGRCTVLDGKPEIAQKRTVTHSNFVRRCRSASQCGRLASITGPSRSIF